MEDHAIVISDTTGVIRMWSSGAEKLFGYDATSAVGQSLDLIVPEALRKLHWGAFHAAMQTGHSKLDRTVSNTPVTCRDGRVVQFPSRFYFLRDGRDRILGAMVIYMSSDDANSPSR